MTYAAAGPTITTDLEARLNEWLRDSGVEDGRRIVRFDDDSMLVSKFEPGFAQTVHAVLDRLPELLDQSTISAAYNATAATAEDATLRVTVWSRAAHNMLADFGAERDIDDNQQALIRVGLISVAALLDTMLWSGPTVGDDYSPRPGEITAFLEATDRLDPDHDLFTRHYGTFEQRRVVNYCPGSPFARVMISQAWIACTGVEPPTAPAPSP